MDLTNRDAILQARMPYGADAWDSDYVGEDYLERAKKYELLLVPSDSFGVPGYVRVSYCVARSTIEHSLPAFEKLAKEYFG